MLQVKRRRIQIRDTSGEVRGSLDDQVLQALASHRRAQTSGEIGADQTNASTATTAGKRVLVRVPDALEGAVVGLHTVTVELDHDIRTREFILGSIVRKVIQGGAAGESFNVIDEDQGPEQNAYRVMEATASAPFTVMVVDNNNYWPMIGAAVQVLVALMPTVDVQIWAYEFARVMINDAAMRSGNNLRSWAVNAAREAFAEDAAHYRQSPVNSLADLTIVSFAHQIRYGDAGPPAS